MSKFIFGISVFVFFLSCAGAKNNSSEKTASNHSAQEKEVIEYYFQYKKTPCYGRCPVYTFELNKDMTCTIDAKQFYKIEGKKVGELNKKQFDKIQGLINDLDVFQLEENYDDTLLADAPVVYFAVNDNGKVKKVRSRAKVPEKVRAFQKEVELLIDQIEWKD